MKWRYTHRQLKASGNNTVPVLLIKGEWKQYCTSLVNILYCCTGVQSIVVKNVFYTVFYSNILFVIIKMMMKNLFRSKKNCLLSHLYTSIIPYSIPYTVYGIRYTVFFFSSSSLFTLQHLEYHNCT